MREDSSACTGCRPSDLALLDAADESDEENEAGEDQQATIAPAVRISTSMVNQATAHLHKNGRCADPQPGNVMAILL